MLCLIWPMMAAAGTQEFTILAVGIDNQSQKAEEIALDYARKRAMYLATRKLGLAAPGDIAARIPPSEYPQIIRGATVLQQKREGYTTYAEVRVTVLDAALRRVLKLHAPDAAMAPTTRAVLVLPVLVTATHVYVWDKDHPLRPLLSRELARQTYGAVTLPGGDLKDLRLIDHENASSVTSEEMKPMFERYGVAEIIIAMAKTPEANSAEPTSIVLRRLSPLGDRHELMDIPPDNAEESRERRLERAAQAIAGAASQIASSTALDDQARRSAAKQFEIRFNYATPKDLAKMTREVRAAKGVVALDLPAIALRQVRGTVYLEAPPEDIRKALETKGVVVRTSGDAWVLSVR